MLNDTDIILTGDRPTGKLHLGHYIGSLKNRVFLQNEINNVTRCFTFIADVQALSDNFYNPAKIKDNIIEVCKDYLSVGIDPNKNTIFVQSLVPELFELTIYYMNLITVARLDRCPTVKAELQLKNFKMSIPSGFLNYPVSQAADITAFKATVIPVGEDQKPVLEITNEIVKRFNSIYNTNILKECSPYLSKCPRLVGIDGKAKASKSLNNAILLSDTSELIKQKVFSMYTDPNHIKVSDPGRIEGNVVFAYLNAFYEDQNELQEIKIKYQRGGVGDTTIKSLLYKSLNNILAPIREKRNTINDAYVRDLLLSGSEMARKTAIETLKQVRYNIGLL